MAKFFVVMLVVLLSGCAAQQYDNNRLSESLLTQPATVVLQQLQKNKPSLRDKVQYQLNVGYLQFITGDFKRAITTLNNAKQDMAALSATSISENITSGLISETLRQYSGYPTDKVMVHNILALSYLFSNQIYDARVEILQSQVAMKALAQGDSKSGQLSSANLLGGIIYELLGEYSNALISYQNAADLITKSSLIVPISVKKALLRVSYKLGATAQYNQYKQQFPELPLPTGKSNKQVFVLYLDGVVSHKIEASVIVPSSNAEQLIRISIPTYSQNKRVFTSIEVSDNKQSNKTHVIEDIEQLVRDDLAKDYASILLLTSTRAIAKYQLVRKAEKQSPLIGLIANIATVVSENADLRSWNMLPASIQFAYLAEDGNQVIIDKANGAQQKVNLSTGKQHVLLVDELSNNVFHYQQ